MSAFHNPLAPKFGRFKAKSAEIKGWVRELLKLHQDTSLTVTELACRDEDCPDIETVIGILEPYKPIVTIRVHSKMAEVTRVDIASAVSVSV